MVLQRAVLWGFVDTNKLTIFFKINNQIYKTISISISMNDANENICLLTLDPISDKGPFDIYVSQPSRNGTLMIITLQDVLFGDSQICSGQFDMQMTVSDILNKNIL